MRHRRSHEGSEDKFKFDPKMRAQALKLEFERLGAFFVYDLEIGDRMLLGLHQNYVPGIEPTRAVLSELTGRDQFSVIADSGDEWENSTISFGTFAHGHGPVEFTQPGILRGCIVPGGDVRVDVAGRDFFNKGANIKDYPEVYVALAINGIGIFR